MRRSHLPAAALLLVLVPACGGKPAPKRRSSYANFECKERRAMYFAVGTMAAQEAGVSIDCAEVGPRVSRWTLSDEGNRVEDSQDLPPEEFDELWKRIDGAGWRNLKDCADDAGPNEPTYSYEIGDWTHVSTFQCDGLHQPFPYDTIVDELDRRAALIRGSQGRNTLEIDDSELGDGPN